MGRWQLQDAKARLSELVRSLETEGPQEITVHGRPAAVLISKADYDRLHAAKPGLVAFLRSSPLSGVELDIKRNRSKVRGVRL